MKSRAILILSMMLLALSLPSISVENTLTPPSESSKAVEQLYEYELYLDSPNSEFGGDGSITTIEPDGDHKEISVLGGVEFRSAEMISDLEAYGRGASSDKVRLSVFLKFTGQQGSTADITYTLQAGESTIATEQSSLDDPCNQGWLGGSCSWTPSEINFDVPSTGFTIPKGKQIRLKVDAQATCGQSSGVGGGNNECDVEMAFGDIESTDSFSRIELKANALSDSSVRVHKPGQMWTNPEVIEWAPNHRPENRQIQFSVDVRDSFGRDDIRSVRLILESPNGISSVFDEEFEDDDLKLDNNGLVGNFTWTYDAGFDAGEYPLTLEIIDQQGHSVLYQHQGLTFVEHAIHLTLPANQPDTMLIAPGRRSTVEFLLEHVGSSSSDIEVEFELARELPSSWADSWSSPEGYELQGGGDFERPTLIIDVPESGLESAPSTIEIIARALAEDSEDSSRLDEVDVQSVIINVEKVGIYAAPRVSAFEDLEHQKQIADSNRPDAYDPDLAHYIDQTDEYGSFYIDVFNTGFDSDQFRIKVLEYPTAWRQFEFYDNATNSLLEKSGLDYLTADVGSHQQTSLRMDVYLPESRDEVDSGPITIEVSSIGGSENKSTISFRVHRTFGILVEVIGDSDSGHLGQVGPIAPGEKANFELRVTDSSKEDVGTKNWQIVKPSALNEENEPEYATWDVSITDTNGTDVNVLRLAKEESSTIYYSITTNKLTEAGNHTVYMKIVDSDSQLDQPDYFLLPVVIQIKEEVVEGNIDVKMVSEKTSFLPNEKKSIEFKVENNNNVELPMIITVSLPSGWEGGMRTESSQDTTKFVNLKVKAFNSQTFTLDLTAPEDLTSNDKIEIDFEVVPMGVSQPYHEDYWQRPSFEFTTECSGMVCLINEIKNPRMSTAFLIGGVLLIGLYAIYRRGASSGRTYEAELEEKYEHEEEIEEEAPKEPEVEQLEIDEDVELMEELADL